MPLLQYLVLCKETSQNEDGSFNIHRGFNVLKQLEPDERERIESFFLLLSVHLRTARNTYHVKIELEAPNGLRVIVAEFYMGFVGGVLVETIQQEFFFKVTKLNGRFWYKIYLDNELIGQTPLYVKAVENEDILSKSFLFD